MIVVLALGCFDPLHYGHLKHLQEAKTYGDHLVVAVTADKFINKPGHPVFTQEQRAEFVFNLKPVDDVAIVTSAGEAIAIIKPQIYVKGIEYVGRLPEKELVESFGGRCVFTRGPVYSSTALLTGGYLKIPSAVGG